MRSTASEMGRPIGERCYPARSSPALSLSSSSPRRPGTPTILTPARGCAGIRPDSQAPAALGALYRQ